MSSPFRIRRPGTFFSQALLTILSILCIVPFVSSQDVQVIGEYDLSPAGGNSIGARRMAFGFDRFWTSDWGNDRITATSTAGNVMWSVDVGAYPIGLDVDETNQEVFVANYGDGTVTVVDAADWGIHPPAIQVGSGPYDVAINQTTDRVYVSNQGYGEPGSSISVIDAHTHDVLDTIAVDYYPNSITIDEDSNLIYVTFLYESHIAVIDGVTHAVGQIPAISDRIRDVAIDLENDRMYFCDYGFNRIGVYIYSTRELITTIGVSYQPKHLLHYSDDDENLLYVVGGVVDIIDLTTHTLSETLILHGDVASVDIQRQPDWNLLFVATSSNRMHSYYPDSLFLWNNQALARYPTAVAADGTIGRAYTVTWSPGEPEGSVWALGTNPTNYRQRIPVTKNPAALAVNPVAGRIYVGHGIDEPTITVINSQTEQVSSTIAAYASDLAVDPITNRTYFVHGGGASYGIIDGYSASVLYYVDKPFAVTHIDIDPGLDRLYITWNYRFYVVDPDTGSEYAQLELNTGDIEVDTVNHIVYLADYTGRQVHVIDGNTNTLVTTIPVDLNPSTLAVDPSARLLFVEGFDNENLLVINTLTNTVSQEIPLGAAPGAVTTDGIGGLVYVSTPVEGTVQILNSSVIFIDGFESGDTSAW